MMKEVTSRGGPFRVVGRGDAGASKNTVIIDEVKGGDLVRGKVVKNADVVAETLKIIGYATAFESVSKYCNIHIYIIY